MEPVAPQSKPYSPKSPKKPVKSISAIEPDAPREPFKPIQGEPSATPILDAVVAELEMVSPGLRGEIWERTAGNKLDALVDQPYSWILQVPDCWGEATKHVGVDKNVGIERLLAKVTANIAQAQRCVDITTWGIPGSLPFAPAGPFPDGRFFDAIGAGLKAAAAEVLLRSVPGQPDVPLTVRILSGVPAGATGTSPEAFLESLKRIIGENAHLIDFYVAVMASLIPKSQNHTKLVVVDGVSVINGGINWMSNYYIEDGGMSVKGGYGGQAPVTDLDIALRGPAATSAGKFLDLLWKWTWNGVGRPKVSIATSGDSRGKPAPKLYGGYKAGSGEGFGGSEGRLDVISVASLGYGILDRDERSRYKPPPVGNIDQAEYKSNNNTNTDVDFMTVNPDANALRAMIENAKDNIVLSQQDINGYSHAPMNHPLFDVRLIDAIVEKIMADPPVKVRIILSNPGYPDYSNISSIEKAASALLSRAILKTKSESVARRILATYLALATFRSSYAPTWPKGYKYRLHTKVVCVDDRAFYVGSRNAYPDTTQDHGFIIEDAEAAGQLKATFLDKQWLYSQGTCYVWQRPS
jgi:phosphatidylserine/phosphatidylglycerophosphate/cardiolipin synthase-like enzyme